MNNRTFSMDEDEMNNAVSILGKAVSKIDTASSTISSSFKGAEESGLFDTALSNMKKNISKSSSFVNNVKTKIEHQNSEIFRNETLLAEKIDDMDVPLDFVKTYERKYTSIDDIELSKKDDKSINSGSKTVDQNEINDSKVEEEKVKDINKGEVKESDSSFDSKTKEERIYDLSKKDVKESKIEVDKSKVKEELKRLLGEEVEEKVIEEDKALEKEEQIKNINNTNSINEANFNFNPQSLNSSTDNQESSETYSTKQEKKKDQDKVQEMLNNYAIMNDFERKQEQVKKENEEVEVY